MTSPEPLALAGGPTFGGWLRLAREQHGMSLSEAAETIGCTKAHIWNLEQGRSTNPSIKTLAGIACAYDADLGDVATMAAVSCPDSGYSASPPTRVVPIIRALASTGDRP